MKGASWSRSAVAKRVLLVFVVLLGTGLALRWLRPPARTPYIGGPILTMDPQDRVVEALAVEGERIAAVGDAPELRAWAAQNGARTVDLGGHALLPGFVDAHGHYPGAGLDAVAAVLSPPPIGAVTSIAGLQAALQTRVEETSEGDWVAGFGYDDTLLAERRHPTRADLDAVSTRHPVAAIHVSGHLAAVNSAGLAKLGIDDSSPDPEGGRIRRGADGHPDGVLEETAAEQAVLLLANPGVLDGLRIVRRANELYLAAGVTTAQVGLATPDQLSSLPRLARIGLVPLRLVLWPSQEASETILDRGPEPTSDDPWLRVGAVKLVADGSLQGYTGYLSQPYFVPPVDDLSYRGYPRFPREDLVRTVERVHRAGLQVAIHGNGDAAIDDILDALEAAQRAAPRADARPVIVHAQTAREDQLDRMAALGAIPSFFVLHTWYWGDRHYERFLGPERASRISPAGSAARRGIPFTLHADTPVVPMEPLRIVWSAVNRRTTGGRVLGPEQSVTPLQALRAITIDAARQQFLENDRGSLEPGKLADLVVLDRSPLDDPEGIDRLRVLETVVGGETAYRTD
ncbi:MAG: amidohydrolase [Deltaproteobacteria bacterium]|nr:amidohydrolase [Deltaproteobacteria bacterium]